MKSYSMLEALYLAFFDKGLYQAAAWKWSGSGLLLLLVVYLIFSASEGLGTFIWGTNFMNRTGQALCDQMPKFKFNDGVLSVEAAEPVTITMPAKHLLN